MSEPTLYRRAPESINGYRGERLTRILEAEMLLIDERAFVPVERCEHGRIDPHVIDSLGGPQEWCPGAGIGDNDE